VPARSAVPEVVGVAGVAVAGCVRTARAQRRWERESDSSQVRRQALESRASVCAPAEDEHCAVCKCHNMQVIFVPGMQAGLAGGGRNGAAIRPAVTGGWPWAARSSSVGRFLPHLARHASGDRSRIALALHLHIEHCTLHRFHLPRRLASTPLRTCTAPTHARFWFARPWALCDIAPLVIRYRPASYVPALHR
jgi:hypothetical protein